MNNFISNPHGKINIRELEDFEKTNEITLPEDYRMYLIEHNGGAPYPAFVKIKNGYTDIQCLFGMYEKPSYSDFFNNLDVYGDRVPGLYIPIGNDSFGNLFILSVREKSFGEVCFWKHEFENKEDDTSEFFDNVEMLHPTFKSFFDSITNTFNDIK